MLRCLAGICGGAAADTSSSASGIHEKRVVKPVVNLSEPQELHHFSAEQLTAHFGLQAGPPNSDPPDALVSPNFQKNSSRLLVLVPAPGTPLGAWAGSDSAGPMILWAQANNFDVALFSAAALAAQPAQVWDRVLKGSPARFVAVVVAGGALSMLQAALVPLHQLLISRFRAVAVACGASVPSLLKDSEGLSKELLNHLAGAMIALPTVDAADKLDLLELFELLLAKEDRWQKNEAKKYAGFQNLKENDMPGLRRMPVETRIDRLDRDRGNDELARLLRKHEKQAGGAESEEEPGVD